MEHMLHLIYQLNNQTMNIKETLSFTLNRFRTVSIKHPVGIVWNNNVMTLYQRGIRFNISNLFEYCYMPKSKVKAIILPGDITKFLDAQLYLVNSKSSTFVIPKKFGFDIAEPNKEGDPLIVYEIRFYSIKNRLIMFGLRFVPEFSTLLKNMK